MAVFVGAARIHPKRYKVHARHCNDFKMVAAQILHNTTHSTNVIRNQRVNVSENLPECNKTVRYKKARGTKKGNKAEPVQWLKINLLMYVKSKHFTIQYKYFLNAGDFCEIDINQRQYTEPITWSMLPLTDAYRKPLPVTDAKKHTFSTSLKRGSFLLNTNITLKAFL